MNYPDPIVKIIPEGTLTIVWGNVFAIVPLRTVGGRIVWLRKVHYRYQLTDSQRGRLVESCQYYTDTELAEIYVRGDYY